LLRLAPRRGGRFAIGMVGRGGYNDWNGNSGNGRILPSGRLHPAIGLATLRTLENRTLKT